MVGKPKKDKQIEEENKLCAYARSHLGFKWSLVIAPKKRKIKNRIRSHSQSVAKN